MHFPAIRKIAVGALIHRGRLTRGDLLGCGDYSLEEADLSACDVEEISESAFESSPSLRSLQLQNNRIRRVERAAFKPIGRSLQTLDLSNGLRMRTLLCEHLFDDLHSLLNLNLMSNDIDSLSNANDCFKNLIQMKVLIMDFNSLRTIS
jgi:Leucine-rich repeat (LRR) protein